MRALTRSDRRKAERIEVRVKARMRKAQRQGTYIPPQEWVATVKAATEHLGTPIPGDLMAKAIEEHGHLGLAALTVAADWTLAARPRPAAPRRISPSRTQPRSRRRRSPRQARAPGRSTSAEDGEPHDGDVARSGGCFCLPGGHE